MKSPAGVDAARPTASLAAWATGLRHEDIPAATRERVALILLDTIASALAGRNSNEVRQLEATAGLLAPGASTTTIGGPKLSPVGAAFVNGYQVTAANLCDVYRPSLCHVTPEVIPPALAVAEGAHVSGRELVTALAAGLETTVRIGVALKYPSFRARGWHSPGVIGPFGGAVAAGRLAGLDAAGMRTALSLAGSQSAGTFAQWGTPGVKFHQARGSMAGLLAARLAGSGFSAAEEILSAEDGGLLNAYSDGGDPAALTRDLGRHWELERISLRLWPTASSIQGAVSAVFDLVARHDVRPADIASLRIALDPTTYKLHGEMTFEDRFHALLSTRYCAAIVLHDRACWLDQFEKQRVGDPAVGEFARSRIEVVADEAVVSNGARVEAQLTDGRSVSVSRDIPHGDADDPATLAEITDKFRMASRGLLPAERCEAALEHLIGIEELDDVDRVIALLGQA